MYWRRVVPLSQKSSIAFPFSRLHNEPFWRLVPIEGKEITPAEINNIGSVSQLRVLAIGATMTTTSPDAQPRWKIGSKTNSSTRTCPYRQELQ